MSEIITVPQSYLSESDIINLENLGLAATALADLARQGVPFENPRVQELWTGIGACVNAL
jgi:hypothetical protein